MQFSINVNCLQHDEYFVIHKRMVCIQFKGKMAHIQINWRYTLTVYLILTAFSELYSRKSAWIWQRHMLRWQVHLWEGTKFVIFTVSKLLGVVVQNSDE